MRQTRKLVGVGIGSVSARGVIVAVSLLAVMVAGYAVSVHRAKAAATGDDELAGNAVANIEVDGIIYWQKNDKPNDDPSTQKHECNLDLSPAPAVPATPTTGDGNGDCSVRVFPDFRYYDEKDKADGEGVPYADRRRRVLAVAEWVKGDPPAQMHFRLWDVDDPSDNDGPIDADTSGPDNRDGTGWHFAGEDASHIVTVNRGKVRRFKVDGGSEEKDLPEGQGDCYKVETMVGLRPGDNYRFAASADKQELVGMTQAMADTAQRTASGRISKILSVWRKLYLELDSMDTNAGSDHVVSSHIDATYANTPHAGESGAEIDSWNPEDDGRYAGGTATTSSGSGPAVTFEIIDHWDDVGDDTLYVVADITPYHGEGISFGDDDQFGSPRTVDWSLLKEKFASAYIEPEEDVEARSLNTPFVPTVRNASVPIYNAAKDRKNRSPSPQYWVALVLSAHQGKLWTEQPPDHIRSLFDGDPDLWYHFHGGAPTKYGDTGVILGTACKPVDPAQRVPNVALVFLEGVREHGAYSAAGWIPPEMRATAQTLEKVIVAHELGHVFGLGEGPEGTLMEDPCFNQARVFSEEHLKGIRESDEIEKEEPFSL